MSFPRVSIFGMGYVGSVAAAALAERGCSVIGCDVSPVKVDQINAGKGPIGEPGSTNSSRSRRRLGGCGQRSMWRRR